MVVELGRWMPALVAVAEHEAVGADGLADRGRPRRQRDRVRLAHAVEQDARIALEELLREAGYYCTNNVRTDYNMRDEQDFILRA